MAKLCRLSIMLLGSLIFTVLSTFFFLLSFSTSSWIEVDDDFRDNPLCQLLNMGLWSFCFKNFRYPNAYYDRVYNKCYWIFSPELWDLQDYLLPSWFKTVQWFVTLSLLLMFASMLAIVFKVCTGSDGRTSLACTGVLNIIVTAMTLISLLIFGHFGHTLENWMPHPSHNGLGYSYGLLVVAGFFALFGGVLALVYRCSKDFIEDFDALERLKALRAEEDPDFDLASAYDLDETASRAQSRVESFYGRSRADKTETDSQYSEGPPMGRMPPPMPPAAHHKLGGYL